jgi:hypothetical protein
MVLCNRKEGFYLSFSPAAGKYSGLPDAITVFCRENYREHIVRIPGLFRKKLPEKTTRDTLSQSSQGIHPRRFSVGSCLNQPSFIRAMKGRL